MIEKVWESYGEVINLVFGAIVECKHCERRQFSLVELFYWSSLYESFAFDKRNSAIGKLYYILNTNIVYCVPDLYFDKLYNFIDLFS